MDMFGHSQISFNHEHLSHILEDAQRDADVGVERLIFND